MGNAEMSERRKKYENIYSFLVLYIELLFIHFIII
jgi:hypothetical protein